MLPFPTHGPAQLRDALKWGNPSGNYQLCLVSGISTQELGKAKCNCFPIHTPWSLALWGLIHLLHIRVEGTLPVVASSNPAQQDMAGVGMALSIVRFLLFGPPAALRPSPLPTAICSGTRAGQRACGAVLSSQWPKSWLPTLWAKGQWQFPEAGALSARTHGVSVDRLYFQSALGWKVNLANLWLVRLALIFSSANWGLYALPCPHRVDNEDQMWWGQEMISCIIPVRLSLNAVLRAWGFGLFLLPSIWGFHMLLIDARVLRRPPPSWVAWFLGPNPNLRQNRSAFMAFAYWSSKVK